MGETRPVTKVWEARIPKKRKRLTWDEVREEILQKKGKEKAGA